MIVGLLHILNALGRPGRSLAAALPALVRVLVQAISSSPRRRAGRVCAPSAGRSLSVTSRRSQRPASLYGLLAILLLAPNAVMAYDADNTATASFNLSGTDYSVASNTVTVTVTPPPAIATLELLHHIGDPAGTPLPTTDYSSTSAPGTFTPLLPNPGPGLLSTAADYAEEEMIGLRVTDSDRNLDPLAIDTITVDVVSSSGDTELLLLRETGGNTGIFLGYVNSSSAPFTPHDGVLSAPAGDTVTLSYDDGGTTRTLSAPVLAAAPASLWLQLEANRALVAPGDPLGYTLTVENLDTVNPATGVTLTQTLPAGFHYRSGTAQLDGATLPDPLLSADGRTLTFTLAALPAGGTGRINFLTVVGAVASGDYPSSAVASALGFSVSNTAQKTVFVRDPFGADRSYLAGRVLMVDSCTEPSTARNLAGVRLFLEDGTFVISDDQGRYHVEGLSPGTHVIQLDPVTYPDGLQPLLCEDHTRSAGNPASRFVELQPGTLWRADFYLARPAANGEVSIALNNTLAIGEAATYTVSLSGTEVSLSNQRLEIELPAEAEYLPGSSLLDGRALMDPLVRGRTLSYDLPDKAGDWQRTVTLRTLIDRDTDSVEMPASARLTFDTAHATGLSTPLAESTLIWISRGERREVRELLLQPKFDTLNAELSENDRNLLRQTADSLKLLDLIKIYVIGHTDARRIRWSKGIAYRDNFELSEARADAVARELLKYLDLDPEQVVKVGLGAADPISTEGNDVSYAQNRRTDLRVLHRVVINPEMDRLSAEGGETRSLKTAASPANPPEKAEDLPLGILSISDGDTLADRIHAVRIRLDGRLKPLLSLDGREIPAERIGFKLIEEDGRTQVMTYVGVDFGAPGEHTLNLRGVDPFGNARYEQTIKVVRTGEIASIRVLESEGNVADGRTPVRVRLELLDASGEVIRAAGKLEVRSGELVPVDVRKDHLPRSPEERLVKVSREGWADFEPVNRSGLYRVTLGYADTDADAEIFVAPEQRDWILVGLATGTAGSRDILDGVEPLPDGSEDGYYDEGRLAFFARGQVKGDWLLTVAYDSDKEDRRNRSLHQVIDPDSYYTLYGDTTAQGYAAASAEELYVRVERERFYAMFGDLDSGLNVTQLSRYSRSLTGFKSEYQGRRAGYSAFVSETAQSYVRDEIPGDGTSGLYRLSRTPLVLNSEKVTLETHDRFHSEQLLEKRTLQRHLDYNIDYADGTLYFKEPIASRDGDFNPVTIVVEYETTSRSSNDLTYGGRGYLRSADETLELGASLAHEGTGALESDLYGVDTKIALGDALTLRGEWATSSSETAGGDVEGDAWLAEASYAAPGRSARLYAREQQQGFGLGQQASSESGTRKLGGDLGLSLGRSWETTAELFTQENLSSGTQRWVGEGDVRYRQERYSLRSGFRHARDEIARGDDETSNQLLLGGDWEAGEKLTLKASHEQSLSDNANRDYPTRTLLGADYELTSSIDLFLQQEFTQGDAADSESTRLGLRAIPWDGSQVRSSLEQQLNENGERTFANLGLTQRWQVTPKLGIDVSLDRSQTLSGNVTTSIHPDQSPATGSPEGYTAVSSGLSWREASRSFDSRIEYRDGEAQDRWGVFAGSIVEPKNDLGLSLSVRFSRSDARDRSWCQSGELRFGLAHRPEHRTWLLLDRLDLIHDAVDDGGGKDEGWRVVNRFNSHWRASADTHVAVNTGVRYVAEKLAEENFDTLTTLLGGELRYDLTPRWDLGLHGSTLNAWESGQVLYRSGLSVGYSPARNLWFSVGYNFSGFSDRDFSAADYTAQGAFVRFRVKFDQQGVREAVELFTR